MSRLSEYSAISGVVFDEVDDLLGGIEAGGGSTIEDLTDDDPPSYITGPNGVRLGWNPATNQFDIPLNAPTSGGGGSSSSAAAGPGTMITTVGGRKVLLDAGTGAILQDIGPATAADMAKSQFITGKNPTTGKTDKALIYVDSAGQPHTIWFNVPVTGSGTGAASNTLRSGSAAVTAAQSAASPSTPGKKALASSAGALNSLMVRKGMTNFEPEGYGSPTKMGDLAFNIAKQGPSAAFRYGAPVSSFEYTSPNATLGPFGGIDSGGLSGEIRSTGPQTAMIGGELGDSAGFGYSAPATLQAYAPAGKSLITGDPVQDQAAAAAIIAMRDQMIAEGASPAQAQQRIQEDLLSQSATYGGTPGAFYPGYAEGGDVEVDVPGALWSRGNWRGLLEGNQDSTDAPGAGAVDTIWSRFKERLKDRGNHSFPALPLGMLQKLYDEHQRQVMSYRRQRAGLPEETPVYDNADPGLLPLGLRYESAPEGYGYPDPGISGSLMTSGDYSLQQEQKRKAQKQARGFGGLLGFAMGGQMITREPITGIGQFTGRPYFQVGEDGNGDGLPDPEMLSIRPLRNMRRPSPKLPLGIMASARAR